MFKSKIKKVVGSVVFAGALLVSGLPANAATLPELDWVMNVYTNAFKFEHFIKNGEHWVYVYTRLSNGKVDVQEVKCETMYNNRCYVEKL